MLYTALTLRPILRAISAAGAAMPNNLISCWVQKLLSGCPTGCPRFRQYAAIFSFQAEDRGRFAAFRTASTTCGGIVLPLSFADDFASAAGVLEYRRPRSNLSSVRSIEICRNLARVPSLYAGTFKALRHARTVEVETPKWCATAGLDSHLTAFTKSPQRIRVAVPRRLTHGQAIKPSEKRPTTTDPRISQKSRLPRRAFGG
jgi:hypothetical protein